MIRGIESHLAEYVPSSKAAIATGFQASSLSSTHKFRNTALEEKTAALQAEFEALLGARDTGARQDFVNKDESFYSTMTEFYSGHKKHESPTRRLMNQMDAACENKSVIQSNLNTGNKYSLTYCPSPDRAYVVEPHQGELDYDNAHKNLDKFYKKVMN